MKVKLYADVTTVVTLTFFVKYEWCNNWHALLAQAFAKLSIS
jgi:hypothetical protein